MAVESQLDFSGGLNTRYPSHRIAANQLTELTDVDLSHGDLRGEYATTTGGQSEHYYEKADLWVSGDGFTATVPIQTWSSSTTTISSDANYYSPMVIGSAHTVTIGASATVRLYEVTQGVHGASSFVEYNDDLYVGRDSFTVTGTWSHSSNQDRITVQTSAGVGEVYKLQVGDELTATNLPENVYVTRIDTGSNYAYINLEAKASGTNATITVNPIISKFLDGVTSTSYRVSALKPDPTITFSNLATDSYTGTDADRADGHSKEWFSDNFVVPFQYGLSHFDATGYESSISELTDSSLSSTYFDKSSNNKPIYIDLGNTVDTLSYSSSKTSGGRFALYRVGGSSSVIKRVDNIFVDDDLTVAVSGTGGDNLTVALGSVKSSWQYRVAWYCFNTDACTKYSYSNGTYSVASSFTGKSDWISGGTSYVLTGSSSVHHVDIIVQQRIPGELIEREYVCRGLSVDDADVANAATYNYVDFQSSDSRIDIQPIEVKNEPPKSGKYLIESGNMFFTAVDTRLHASDYGNPNSWRNGGYLDFDQKITGLSTIGSELVVFTQYGISRVFGTDPLNLKKVRVPTTEGVPDGGSKTIAKFQQGIMFGSHLGVSFYNGRTVERLTHDLLGSFSYPDSTTANNAGGFFDDVYYLIGASGTGLKVDLKSSPLKVSNTSFNGSKLYYRGADNILYSDTGRPGFITGDRTSFTVKTRKFSAGDINTEKIYRSVRITGEDFSGTVNVFVDGSQTDTFSVSAAVADFDRTFYLTLPRHGNGLQVQLLAATGIVHRINVDFELAEGITEQLFESVQVQYTGTPSITVALDGLNVIGDPTPTTLSSPSPATIGEAVLYFPEMTTGLVPHIKETTSEVSGRILGYQYKVSAV